MRLEGTLEKNMLLDFFGSDDNVTPSSYTMLPAGAGVLERGAPSYFELEMFGTPNLNPDGVNLIDQRSNTSFFNFDQSKVSASIIDVMKSGAEAALRVGVQAASDSINRGSNQNTMLGSFLNNFRSTKTGAQIQAGAAASRAQAWLLNPIVWVAGIGLVALVFVLRK